MPIAAALLLVPPLQSDVEMFQLDPNPDWDMIDVRAVAEKRRQKAILDEEWRRQQSLLAKPFSYTIKLDRDVRIQGTERDWIREDWTHEEIMNLILGGGKYVHPDKVPVRPGGGGALEMGMGCVVWHRWTAGAPGCKPVRVK